MLSSRLLLVGSQAVMAAAALLLVAPSHATELSCDGKDKLINTSADRGDLCGILNVGDTFRINLLDYILRVVGNEGAFNAIGASISHGSGNVSFADVGVIASGTVDLGPPGEEPFTITNAPIALWGSDPVLATSNEVSVFSASSFFEPLNSFRTASFTLSPTDGTASVGGLVASSATIRLTDPTQFDLVGTYLGGASPDTKIFIGITTFINLGRDALGNPIKEAPSSPSSIDFDTAAFNGGHFSVVPGPLPLAGAGAALAWSRALRRRIKASQAHDQPR
jgi:hypothetical protein